MLFFVKEFIVNPIIALDHFTHSPKNHSDDVILRADIETVFPGLTPIQVCSGRVHRQPFRNTRVGNWLNKLYVQHWRIWFDSG